MKPLINDLIRICGHDRVLTSPSDLALYSYDASMAHGTLPDAVVLPGATDEVSRIVKAAARHGVPFLPRGSGTNLSGGTVPVKGGIVIEFSRMNRIIEIDIENERAVVEPGVFNQQLQDALSPFGYLYAPDPASQRVSTIGGNVGENSGGPHCFKYGVTTNHVLGLEVVMPDGEILWIGGRTEDRPGYDLAGIIVGSEGTLCAVTRVIVKIMRKPRSTSTMLAVFRSMEEAGKAVSEIIARGIIPATLEIMDKVVINAVEASMHAGYPPDAGAVLIIELDGIPDGMERLSRQIVKISKGNGATEVKTAADDSARENLWAGRRGAFGSLTRVRPNYMVNDGTVPRTKLPEVLKEVERISKKYGLKIGNVFHAGDGNLHPNILYDDRDPDEKRKVIEAGTEILEVCARAGGTITGEHGIGTEKIDALRLVFPPSSISAMRDVKAVFDAEGIANPGKIFPGEAFPSPLAGEGQGEGGKYKHHEHR